MEKSDENQFLLLTGGIFRTIALGWLAASLYQKGKTPGERLPR